MGQLLPWSYGSWINIYSVCMPAIYYWCTIQQVYNIAPLEHNICTPSQSAYVLIGVKFDIYLNKN
jgi:hypothetical protein